MKKENNFSYAELTDDQLVELKNNLEVEYGKLIDEWGREVGYLVKEKNVDPYSRLGERKINKVIKKYADVSGPIKNIIEDIEFELAKRDNYKFQQSFIGGKSYYDENMTEAEFFEKESLKTEKYRQSISGEKLEDDE